MEQKIKLESATTFHLPREEQRIMFTYLALAQYSYMRKPNYNENALLKMLCIDLKKLLLESQRLSEKDPNNHQLNRMRSFFDNHYKQLKKVLDEE